MSKKIKLLVEIDEDYYELIKADVKSGNDYKPCVLIANGTPITEGDLISRSALIKEAEELRQITSDESLRFENFTDLIDNAPSIGISEENLKPTSELVKGIVGFDASKMPKLPEYHENGNETN